MFGEGKEEPTYSNAILASLAKSNEPPSSADEAALRREREEHARAVTSMDTEMAQLQASIVALEKRRKRFGGRSPAYKLALNPVRRLPNEILAHIFMFCVDGEVKCLHRSLWPGKPPWVLTQICRKWRMVSVSLPQLWSTIGVNWTRSSEEKRALDLPKVERLLSLSLQRARDKPLSISWSQTYSHKELLLMLLTRSYQWKDAKITCGLQGLEQLCPYIGMFPNLTSLHLRTDEDDWLGAIPEEPIFSVFQDAPSLRRLTLSGESMAWWLLTEFVPWKQILQFTITDVVHNIDFADDQDLLFFPLMENVQVCAIELHAYIFPTGPFQLPHLHTLTLHPYREGEPDVLLDSLVLPALKALHLTEDFCSTDAEAILNMVTRSSCQLEELTLFGENIGTVVDLEWSPDFFYSDGLKSVTQLHLSGGKRDENCRASIPDEVLDALRFVKSGSSQRTPLPRLRSLRITGIKQWPDATLVNMLASRRGVGHLPAGTATRLEEILLWGTGNDGFVLEDAVAKAQLAQLVEGGLIANFS
ncbi:hypothetical protein V5O48_003461 [Marasmius crinis-equi]|uniref:F-box domain-containing protein n=1 Tax=Marasmius crinis-equi TaxID=585013 RepID=A0ABR3FSS8_9AGAR